MLISQVDCEITMAAGTHSEYKLGFYINKNVASLTWRILLHPLVF
jgi:hypothetical protein